MLMYVNEPPVGRCISHAMSVVKFNGLSQIARLFLKSVFKCFRCGCG